MGGRDRQSRREVKQLQHAPILPFRQAFAASLPYRQEPCTLRLVYGRILKELRIAQGRSQADVARTVGISAAQLARLESHQRGLYLEDFVRIAEALGEKPGNLLPNDLGSIGHLKLIIDRLASLRPQHLPLAAAIIDKIVALTESMDGKAGRKTMSSGGSKHR